MNCEELRGRLDAYMDGELSGDALREMEAHAATCADCRREFEAARLVREALGALPDEVAVPLEAQAGWRRAVRAEAKRRRARGWMRAGCAVAAALALVLGATALLRNAPARGDLVPVEGDPVPRSAAMEVAAEPTSAVVARDGEAEARIAPEPGEEAYAAIKKYRAEDVNAARATIEALVEEYGGRIEVAQSGDPARSDGELDPEDCVICRIELPREYLDDFLSAASHVGEELDSGRTEAEDWQGETALVSIQIDGELTVEEDE